MTIDCTNDSSNIHGIENICKIEMQTTITKMANRENTWS